MTVSIDAALEIGAPVTPDVPPAGPSLAADGTWWADLRAGLGSRPSLSPVTLLDVAREFAVGASAPVGPDGRPPTERTYDLLHSNDLFEVWVIHWPQGGHLELHDHGGSSGAFWVVDGTLEECHFRPGRDHGRFAHRCHAASSGVGFDARYVHDVVNGGQTPATSVHAYSPPMTSMNFYRCEGASLVAERTDYRMDAAWTP